MASVRHRNHCFPFTCLSLMFHLLFFSIPLHSRRRRRRRPAIIRRTVSLFFYQVRRIRQKGSFLCLILLRRRRLLLRKTTFGRSIGRGQACCCMLYPFSNGLIHLVRWMFGNDGIPLCCCCYYIHCRSCCCILSRTADRTRGHACCCILLNTTDISI